MNSDDVKGIFAILFFGVWLFVLGYSFGGITNKEICSEYFDNDYQVLACSKMKHEGLKMKDIVNSEVIKNLHGIK